MRNRIVMLGYNEAIEKIKDKESVFYRHGVWNKYEKIPAEKAIKSINASGYGADIYHDDTTDEYYVSIPCDSDMW